jgi:hypothetical protein
VTYVNAVAPVAGAFDGYLIHGRPGNPATLDGLDGRVRAGTVRVRTDSSAPVLIVQTETDVVGVLGALGSRQPDTERLRLWEVAGAAHADTYTIGAGFRDSGRLTAAELADLLAPTADPLGVAFPMPINGGAQRHYVEQAALAALDRWVGTGLPPASAPRLATRRDEPGMLELDRDGIALGGVRTPWVDVPVATLSGLGRDAAGAAIIFGSTRAFDAATLASRYPGGRDEFLARFRASADDAAGKGFLLPSDLDEIVAVAGASYPDTGPDRR